MIRATKKLSATALILLGLVAAACDDSEYFYSVAYPVTRIEIEVEADGTTAPTDRTTGNPDTDADEGTSGGSTGNDNGDTPGGSTGNDNDDNNGNTPGENGDENGDGGETGNPLVDRIRAEALAAAPVQAGGIYQLDFKYADSGRLLVRNPDGTNRRGGFAKQPGSHTLRFYFDPEAYACEISTYRNEEGVRHTLLTVDLTQFYQERYPDAGIVRVHRLEYTAHRP